jgi:hypothetical protein
MITRNLYVSNTSHNSWHDYTISVLVRYSDLAPRALQLLSLSSHTRGWWRARIRRICSEFDIIAELHALSIEPRTRMENGTRSFIKLVVPQLQVLNILAFFCCRPLMKCNCHEYNSDVLDTNGSNRRGKITGTSYCFWPVSLLLPRPHLQPQPPTHPPQQQPWLSPTRPSRRCRRPTTKCPSISRLRTVPRPHHRRRSRAISCRSSNKKIGRQRRRARSASLRPSMYTFRKTIQTLLYVLDASVASRRDVMLSTSGCMVTSVVC